MKLVRSAHHEIAEMRATKAGSYRVPLLAGFHAHLAGHAQAYRVVDGAATVGYALVLEDRHGDHVHHTLLETYLDPVYADRYEDLFDLIKEEMAPRAYLVRSDECLLVTALLSRGMQLEMSRALMVARAVHPPDNMPGLSLHPLDYPHLKAVRNVFVHVRGEADAPSLEELQATVPRDEWWVLTVAGEVVGVVAHEAAAGGIYGVIDVLAPYRVPEEQQWAVLTAGRMLEKAGLVPSALVDMADLGKVELFRRADYFTAAAYLIFYDPLAGRPSVGVVTREELWGALQRGEPLRLVDVMGEEHWKEGHLPGSEWLDFRSLSREAKKRFQKDEPIVVYCNDFG